MTEVLRLHQEQVEEREKRHRKDVDTLIRGFKNQLDIMLFSGHPRQGKHKVLTLNGKKNKIIYIYIYIKSVVSLKIS